MNDNHPLGAPRGAVPTPMRVHATEVETTWIEKRIEHWIRFGTIRQERLVSRSTRILSFQPGDVFALVRWAANDLGTTVSRLDIVRAVAPPEPYATLPYVRPGGERLLSVNGWNNVQAALHAIDLVEKSGVDPADAAHDHWRHVHNRLTVGHQPRPYSAERHRAWLLRREARS